MRGQLILPLFLAAAIFLLQGGDCLNLIFANQQTHDCCQKGRCTPKNPDPCCQVTAKTTVMQDQAKEKDALLDFAALPVLQAGTPLLVASVDPHSRYRMTFAPSPPGQLGNFSLPLIV